MTVYVNRTRLLLVQIKMERNEEPIHREKLLLFGTKDFDSLRPENMCDLNEVNSIIRMCMKITR